MSRSGRNNIIIEFISKLLSMRRTGIIAALAFCLCISEVASLHLYLTEGKEKCIFDDVPKKELVVGYYDLIDPLPGVDPADTTQGVTITAYDPEGSTALTKIARGKGKFSFKTTMSY